MTNRPTYDDANLILRLYEMRREERMRQARVWFTAKCKVKSFEELIKLAPVGSDENASFRMVVWDWDLVGSFITTGVLNRELFFQSGREFLVVFERLREALPSIREAYKDPNYLKHFEVVGLQFAEYFQGQSNEAYEALLKRIK